MAKPKKWILRLVVGLVCCSLPVWAQNPSSRDATDPSPSITCDQPEVNLGKVPQGELIKHIFTIKNKGAGFLKIKRVSGG